MLRSPNGASGGDGIETNDRQRAAATETARLRPRKSAEAFRTISEVADELNVPQHVLRFWETKFPRIKPLKRGGGRRYYRPEDVSLLRHIANLLYIQGYTIKGVQRLLKEGGGALVDNIPPASAEEQAAAAVEQSIGTSVAMFDVDMPEAMPPQAASSSPPAAPFVNEISKNESSEAEHLRLVLVEILRALEVLRASLH